MTPGAWFFVASVAVAHGVSWWLSWRYDQAQRRCEDFLEEMRQQQLTLAEVQATWIAARQRLEVQSALYQVQGRLWLEERLREQGLAAWEEEDDAE